MTNLNIIDQYVGKRLREKRLLSGFSQEVFAQKIEVTFQQVQKYEKGINRISASRLYCASVALEEPVGYFFDGLPGQNKTGGKNSLIDDAKIVEMNNLKNDTLQIVRAFYNISDPLLRKSIKDLLHAMSQNRTAL